MHERSSRSICWWRSPLHRHGVRNKFCIMWTGRVHGCTARRVMRTCAPFSVQQRHGPYRACRRGNRFHPHQRCSLTIKEPITSRWGIPYHTLSLIIPLGALQNNNQHCEVVRWCTPMWQLTGGQTKCQIYVQEDYVSHYST
jgi:hypothetical protein